MLKPQHVKERHLDHHRIPHFRMLCEFDSHEQTAIRSADDAKAARRSDFARHQVLGHGVKVVVNTLAMGLEPGLMPGWPKLTAAPDIGQHVYASMLQPQLAI